MNACHLCKEEFGLTWLAQREGYCALCGRESRCVVDVASGNMRYIMRNARIALRNFRRGFQMMREDAQGEAWVTI